MSNFISADDLAAAIEDRASQPVLLDLRFDPGAGSAPDRFEQSHLPGARFVRLEEVFADPRATGGGNAPLPSPTELESSLRELGIDDDTDIVVYDDTSGGPSARAWWVLRWAGATRVRVLDGGFRAWVAGGHAVVSGAEGTPVDPGTFVVKSGQLPSIDVAEVAQIVARAGDDEVAPVLVDTRGPAQFDGTAANPRSGHIPGATNIPQTRFTQDDGTVAERAVIEKLFARIGKGGDQVVLHCGAGISSAYAALAAAEYGISTTLYPGSFSDWVSDDARPVEQNQQDGA